MLLFHNIVTKNSIVAFTCMLYHGNTLSNAEWVSYHSTFVGDAQVFPYFDKCIDESGFNVGSITRENFLDG